VDFRGQGWPKIIISPATLSKQLLQACLKDKEAFNDKVHLYFQQIREGFNRILIQTISQEDKQTIIRLITLFFGFEPEQTPLTDVDDSKFRV
jgi:hypothetical protein